MKSFYVLYIHDEGLKMKLEQGPNPDSVLREFERWAHRYNYQVEVLGLAEGTISNIMPFKTVTEIREYKLSVLPLARPI